MAQRPQILVTAQAQFPKSANKTVMVTAAWRRADSTRERPLPHGSDGWKQVGKPATYEVVKDLKDQGFTYVNLETGGVAWGHLDVHISELI